MKKYFLNGLGNITLIYSYSTSISVSYTHLFLHGYRNIVVIRKMTFPNDKVLTIELSEKQISGRNISLNIDYEDVLSADSFNEVLLNEE